MFKLYLKRGFLGIGSLPKTSTRFAPDVVVNLSLGEKCAK
jgi:hypothetical protein